MSRIYLVDDHAMVRDGMRAVLEGAGHEVIGESDQLDRAIADVQKLQPDVVLLDLNLGERSGLDFLVARQQRKLPVRCIVLTMSTQSRNVAEAMRLGAAGYVLKGSPAREVLAAIQTVLTGRRHIGPDIADMAVTALSGDAAADPLDSLSVRERQILTLVVRGMSSAVIGRELHLSPKTVDTYRSRLMGKLGVSDVTGLVRWAIRRGLLEDD